MDLSFFTGNQTLQPGALSWLSGNNQKQNFSTPAMNYRPGQTVGMDFLNGSLDSSLFGSGNDSGLTDQLGMNIPTFQLGLDALGSLANIYGGFQANKLAKNQLNFAKSVTNTNLNNQIKSYNTALEDRARSRATAENRDQSSADAYIAANKLTR
ncbi:putative structural protein [Escherichia phage vB_EcoP_G7C]|uniref:Putative structural protein n=1 Tax=Escherichia phage vB_EcoP_G7C TaxID=1054461 RepID=G0XNV2_9CAUD|nr:putative structural protein [Escherichia phage vB_EcoP_G7C]AEL79663.1 putative structural protein [Escherichia phage vB_EcoP_G7C]